MMIKTKHFKKLGYFLDFHLNNFALDPGVVKGHPDYKKFIILGTARTGSNFLRSLLNSHKHVIAFGEIFSDYNAIDWQLPVYKFRSNRVLTLIQNDPTAFLESKVFRNYPRYVSAVGFKIFYNHAQNENWKPVWLHLKDMGVRVIHIKRKNLLKTYLSEQKAFKTGEWINTSGSNNKRASLLHLTMRSVLNASLAP